MAVLTVHHWTDLAAGVSEMLRVARRRVAVLTWDSTVFRDFWLVREYLPAAGETDARLAVSMDTLISLLGNHQVSVVPIPVPHDLFRRFRWRILAPAARLPRRRRPGGHVAVRVDTQTPSAGGAGVSSFRLGKRHLGTKTRGLAPGIRTGPGIPPARQPSRLTRSHPSSGSNMCAGSIPSCRATCVVSQYSRQ